ncbi:MAG: zinc carboxypeptidase [Acidimicrobiia bacterium]|nr:zinc carboxypeptidase [Acidimicrobiia bacterium]
MIPLPGIAVPDRADPREGPLQAFEGTVEPQQLQKMREDGIDVSQQEATDEGFRIEVIGTEAQIADLAADGIELSPRDGVARRRAAAQADGVYKPWDGPDGIEARILATAGAYPRLVKLVDIGDTIQGRDVWALKVTKNANQRSDGQRPAVLYSAAQHAREWITPEMNLRLLDYFLENYDTDSEIRGLLDKTELWFVPVANPDGYQYTHTTDRLWRKNLRDNNGDGEITPGDGVDLNRNFAYTWNYDNEGSATDPFDETYRGTAPNSEPETQAMDGLLADIGFEYQINYHSAAELLLYGTGWQVATPTPDDVVYEALAGNDADSAIPGYDPDISAELYTTNGETTNHAHAMYDTLAFTPEMSTCQTASNRDPDDEWEAADCQSGFNFPDDEELIQEEFQNNLAFALDVAKSAQNPDEPVSHLGNSVPDFVVAEFSTSYGSDQTVQAVADRDLGKVRMYYRINDGKRQLDNTSEWDGGERYGDEFDTYYHYVRGEVEGASPGDSVEVWFEANGKKSEPFTYTVADDIGGDVLVVADTNYGNEIAGGVTELLYVDYYGDALEANGYTWDLYDVVAQDEAPDPLGVLSHYDSVIWYTGDNLVTEFQGGIASTKLAHDMNIVLRDYINEGGKLVATGKNVGFQEFFGVTYGEDTNPDEPCTSGDCLILSNDFFQYYLGGTERARHGGLDTDANARPLEGIDAPYQEYAWTLDGGDSAANQGSVDGTNTKGTGTASWITTSFRLPSDDYPLFTSFGSVEWAGEGAAPPFEPRTGEFYAASQIADESYKRLTRTVDLSGATSASLEFWTSYNTEGNWDFLTVEAHTVGEDDWTTLPDANGHTDQTTGDSCASGWDDIHPFTTHYQGPNCEPTGTTGEWHATSGPSEGWEQWSIDLSSYAGSEVEVSITYISDWATQGVGVFVDDTTVTVDGASIAETSFEDDLGGWTVPGQPEGTRDNPNDWARSESLFDFKAAVTTEDSVLHGFGFEGISTAEERNEIMDRTLDHLDE